MIALIYAVYSLTLFRHSSRPSWGLLLISGALILAINAFWILSGGATHTGHGTITSFQESDVQAFAGRAISPIGAEYTHMLGYGFWASRYPDNLLSVEQFSPFWYAAGTVFLLIALLGYIFFWKQKKSLRGLIFFGIVGIASLIF